MRVVVTGREGQIVKSLIERGTAAGHQIIPLGRPELDLTVPASLTTTITEAAPDVIVSAAAYTAVDKAEDEPELARAVNGIAPGHIASLAKSLSVPIVHISTDYVFDGAATRPYIEGDTTAPTGVYGATKLLGEQAVLAGHDDSVVLRVAWVYSPFGGNFVKTMLRLAGDRNEVSVVADQIGNPTSAIEIADAILKICANLRADSSPELRGTFHMTAQGEASWADFAKAIFAASAAHGGPSARVRSIPTSEYPTPAARPANSRLDCSAIAKVHGIILPEWTGSLDAVVARLVPAAR